MATMSLLKYCIAFSLLLPSNAWDVAGTPPMGYNTWNYWGCSVNGTILMDTGKAMVDRGLAAAGYVYVNSDDCWMQLARDASGRQIANPSKFPDGFQAVTTYLHSIGLKSGLYTAKGPSTCAGFAASCDHEFIDAAQWADWQIDYVKDDSCSTCPNRTDNDDYSVMWTAIQASGRPMVLTVEGNPDDALITLGGFGNAKRVGHDISPEWMSMVSLVDIGSGLWPFAHNSSNTTVGGWWNDLDMLEVGNSPDFACGADDYALIRCQAHMTMWTIMKAPLIMGNNVPVIDATTLTVLVNPEAIAVSQDSWGVQAKRVAVQSPADTSLGGAYDNIAVIAPCNTSRPTQTWFWNNNTSPIRNQLFTVACNPSDPYQQWTFVGQAGQKVLKNTGSGSCVDAAGPFDPAEVFPCVPTSTTQQWTIAANGHVGTAASRCLDVYNFVGPDVEIGYCKVPGDNDANQQWTFTQGALLSNSTGKCLAVTSGPGGGTLSTVDSTGAQWCLNNRFGAEGGWGGDNCTTTARIPAFVPTSRNPPAAGPANYTLESSQGSPSWNTQVGASGPWAHTRYISGWGDGTWTLDLAAAQTSQGTLVMAADHNGIIDDDLVGHVTVGGDFCLDLVTGGGLEVWAGPLSEGKIAVALFNRSPAVDSITATWSDIGASAGSAYSVRDIWAAANRGSFTGSYSSAVPAHGTVYLVLSPA